jgi:hypothetical protein
VISKAGSRFPSSSSVPAAARSITVLRLDRAHGESVAPGVVGWPRGESVDRQVLRARSETVLVPARWLYATLAVTFVLVPVGAGGVGSMAAEP